MVRNLTKAFIGLVLITGLLSSTYKITAHAQDQSQPSSSQIISVTISPLFLDITGKPGDVIEKTLKVTSIHSESTQRYIMELRPFSADESGKTEIVDEEDPQYSLRSWVEFSPTEIELKPGETKVVNATIRIPLDAEPGGRYGAFLASTREEAAISSGAGAVTVQKVGALAFVTIEGDIRYSGYVKEFFASRFWYQQPPIEFTTKLFNNGTAHFRPKGFINLTNTFGQKVDAIAFPDNAVLPGNARVFKSEKDGLGVGYYTASLFLQLGDKTTVSSTIKFLILPWPWIVISLLILYLVIVTIKRRKRIMAAYRAFSSRD